MHIIVQIHLSFNHKIPNIVHHLKTLYGCNQASKRFGQYLLVHTTHLPVYSGQIDCHRNTKLSQF